MLFIDPDVESNEFVIVGRLQLSSIHFVTDAWFNSVWSTKLVFEHGDTTRNGVRGPNPQRPCSLPRWVALDPHRFVPVSASDVVCDEFWGWLAFCAPDHTWSYQPSESS